jgi:hypothetical protein
MSDASFDHPRRTVPPAPHVATLLVSVFLVLLCFFIVLSSHSQSDAKRRAAVLQSVNQAFSPQGKQPGLGLPMPGEADMVSVNAFFDDAKISIATRVPLHEIETSVQGNRLILSLPSLSLYARDDAKLRRGRTGFYEILGDLLGRWKDSADISIRMIQHVPEGNAAALSLAVGRGGNFARLLENRGVTPGRIAIALSHGDSDRINLIFDVAPLAEKSATGKDK